MSENKSPAVQLLDLVWKHCNTATTHSYERLNHSMRNALSLAIGAGFEFHEDDYKYILGAYRTGYWIGASTEWFYTEAIAVENMSAIKTYEKHKERQPFIADGVTITSNNGYTHGSHLVRKRERLCVGATFVWEGQRVRVTSFAEDNSRLTACIIRHTPAEGEKVAKRFKITRQMILDARKKSRKD